MADFYKEVKTVLATEVASLAASASRRLILIVENTGDHDIRFGFWGDLTASPIASEVITIYDAGAVEDSTPTYFVLDPGFPYSGIDYPFEVVINGSIYSYLGNGEYIAVDTDHPSLYAEQLPEGEGLVILDGYGVDDEEESGTTGSGAGILVKAGTRFTLNTTANNVSIVNEDIYVVSIGGDSLVNIITLRQTF